MADRSRRITEVKGTIETADGKVTEFNIVADLGWQQWGAPTEVLGTRVDAVDAMAQALAEHLASDDDEDDDEENDLDLDTEDDTQDDADAVYHEYDRLTVYRTHDDREALVVFGGGDLTGYKPLRDRAGRVRVGYLRPDGTEEPEWSKVEYGYHDPRLADLTPIRPLPDPTEG